MIWRRDKSWWDYAYRNYLKEDSMRIHIRNGAFKF
ncbi:MAG: hypothetical protein BWY15_01577 [Firmicutes bacterium ADurb.Bin193]|nr:MAG: hypothetical protein BWY15_01577 [Firmicutes bacterium ADurb.Bin193]